MTELESKSQQIKCIPPLKTLPSYISNSIVLSYFGYADEVKDLLALLSCNSRLYLKSHETILDGFVTEESQDSILARILKISK